MRRIEACCSCVLESAHEQFLKGGRLARCKPARNERGDRAARVQDVRLEKRPVERRDLRPSPEV